MQPGLTVEFKVLTGIENVEASNPERHRSREQQNPWIERAPHAANTNMALDMMTNVTTNPGVSCPAGKARVLVRGLAPSMAASAHRLKAMAAERAAIMAMMIHISWRPVGNPPAASIAPQSANGSANTECSHLIISSVMRRLCRRGTGRL